MNKLKILLSMLACILPLSIQEEIDVTIPDGTIRGWSIETNTGLTYYSFSNIPYATPPLGDLRFQPPVPVEPWNGTVDGTNFKHMCYQASSDNEYEDEDCLVVNVHTANLFNSTLTPVMVYIHGGAFIGGSGWIGPDFWVESGVVLVAINYRLGPFGFLYTNDEVIPGNVGLKDQQLALKWVKNSIEYFGGDPEQVTIFGHSAGGASVSYHLISANSEGLFRAAICQSGSALSPWAYQRDQQGYTYQTANILDSNFTEHNTTKELLAFLKSVPARDLDAASFKLISQEPRDKIQIQQGIYYAPVIEQQSEGAFISDYMYELFLNEKVNKVPLIIGIAAEEYLSNYGDSLKEDLDIFENDTTYYVPNDLHITNAERLIYAGIRIADFYQIYEDKTYDVELAAGIRYFSDQCFTRSVIKQAEIQSNYTDVWFYVFSYDGLMGGCNISLPGTGNVTHGEDINYTFSGQDNTDLSKFPENDVITHYRLLKLWSNFAKYLDPTPEVDELFQNLTWPKVNVEEDKALKYLDINANLSVQTNPRGEAYKFWNGIYNTYGKQPFDTY